MKHLRELVSLGCRVLAAAGQGDMIWGHVSARDPEGRGMWMKSAGLGFEEVGPDDVVLVAWNGDVLAGDRRRHAEYPIHTEAALARPDVGAVVHSHPAHSVAFASLGVPLRPVSHEANFFQPEQVPRFTATGDLILTRELGTQVATALGTAKGCFLVNHGVVTVGPDVPTAVLGAILLDRACQTQLLAMSAGGWATWSDPQESSAKREHCYPEPLLRDAWAYLVRQLG